MPRNTSGLKRGGQPGRPKGLPNKATREIQAFARGLLEDPDYVRKLIARLQAGKATHLEPLLYHYGYGKPKDVLSVEGGPVPLVIEGLKRDA
jgi:hypothetical protein